MTDSLEELVQLYALDMSERERAELESQIWSLVPRSERPDGGIGLYFANKFRVSIYSVRSRHSLFRAGRDADILWNKIDSGMPFNTAVVIYREAREKNASYESIGAAILSILAKYESSGHEAKTASGKVFRRKNQSRLPEPHDLGPVSEPEPAPVSEPTPSRQAPEGRAFWTGLRRTVSEYLDDRLKDCDPTEVDNLRRRVEADLNVLIVDMQEMIRRVPTSGLMSLNTSISRQKVIGACHTLGMDPPSPNKPVNMKQAKLQRKLYVRQYHPDVHGGSEITRPLFEATNDAFNLIVAYNESLSSTK